MTSQHSPVPQRYSMVALTAALILGLILCYFITLPFIPALVWALTLAVLLAPVERALRAKLKAPNVTVSLTLMLAAFMVVTPVILVSGALINEIIENANSLNAMLSAENWSDLARRHPALSPAILWAANNLDMQQLLQSLTARLAEWSATFVRGSISSVVTLLLTFYFLFYLLRDQARALAALERMMPLSHVEFRTLVDRIVQTIIASVYGTAAVAALQGFLGGLMFWWLDLPSPVFWGVIMGLLAIVPFLGAFIVWVPASIALALDGQLLSAVVLAVWGTVVVGLIDNIIYPILVGRRLALHSMLSFIAIIGGLVLFGPHGVVLGPIIVAGSRTLLEIWRARLDLEYRVNPVAQ